MRLLPLRSSRLPVLPDPNRLSRRGTASATEAARGAAPEERRRTAPVSTYSGCGGDDGHVEQRRLAEGRGHRDVGSVAATADDGPPDAPLTVVAGVERVPPVAEVDLSPRAE